jgi:hypothetical protein
MQSENDADTEKSLEPLILLVRGQRVIADLDLARSFTAFQPRRSTKL